MSPTSISPVLPYYAAHPYIALIARGDPTGLARTFDDRYFMASTELNLLNTLLFVDDSSTGEHDHVLCTGCAGYGVALATTELAR